MKQEIKQLKENIKKDSEILEATLNLTTTTMTIGEIKEYLKTAENLEEQLEENLLKLELLKGD